MSVDPPPLAEKLRQKVGLDIRFLSDCDGTLMDALGIRHRDAMPPGFISGEAGKQSRDLHLPTSYLLDEDGVIRWVYRPDTYRVRAPIADVIGAIDATAQARVERR